MASVGSSHGSDLQGPGQPTQSSLDITDHLSILKALDSSSQSFTRHMNSRNLITGPLTFLPWKELLRVVSSWQYIRRLPFGWATVLSFLLSFPSMQSKGDEAALKYLFQSSLGYSPGMDYTKNVGISKNRNVWMNLPFYLKGNFFENEMLIWSSVHLMAVFPLWVWAVMQLWSFSCACRFQWEQVKSKLQASNWRARKKSVWRVQLYVLDIFCLNQFF